MKFIGFINAASTENHGRDKKNDKIDEFYPQIFFF